MTVRQEPGARATIREVAPARDGEGGMSWYAVVHEHAPFAVSLTRLADRRLVEVNPAWTRMFGFSREEALGRDSAELGIVADPAARARLYADLRERPGVREWETPYVNRAGEHRWFRGIASAVDVEGERLMLMTAFDVTDQKHTDEALRAANADLRDSEARVAAQKRAFELAVSGAPIAEVLGFLAAAARQQLGGGARTAVVVADPDRTRLRVAATAGLPDAFVRAMDGLLVGPGAPSCGAAVHRGEPVVVRDVAADPAWAPFLEVARAHGIRACWSVPLRSSGGGVLGALAAYHAACREPTPEDFQRLDLLAQTASLVIERHRAEEALRQSEQRYRTMGETLPYGVWLCNAEGGSEYVSQSFLDLLEMSAEEQRAFGWTRRLPPEDVEPMLERWLHCVRTGTPWDSEHRVLGPDGKYHHVLTRGLPVRDADGKITSWVGINLDIDERKKMEEELREADRRKTEFLGVLSHELRNPLAPIRNSIWLLERAPPGSEQATRAREVIRRQTEHLARLVDDLLDVTRIARGKIALQRARVDLRDVVRRTTDDLRSVFARAGVALRVEPVDGPVRIDADPVRIAQVLGNLLQNAVKFTPSGGSVAVSAAARGGLAELSVRDTGVGMDPASIPRMFEPFTQADQTLARTNGGLGIGLALVKGLVELHDGSVEARSEGPGRGAEFVVRLPLA